MAPYSNVATKTDPALVALIHDLKKRALAQDAPIWRDVAVRLEKPTRERVAVNVSQLDRVAADRSTVVVPGKVLAAGTLTKHLTVGALAFSEEARAKVTKAGGKCLTIAELAGQHPDGSNVRILG